MPEALNIPSKNNRKAIFRAWLIVGTLDITAATIHFLLNGGKNPLNILVYISSGLFGQDAYTIGVPSMAVLGIILHYFIAFGWTVIFFTLYPRMPVLSKNRLLTGIGYGIVMQIIMGQFIVRVISRIPARPFNPTGQLISAGILCVAIGIPLSFMAYRHFYGRKST